MLRSDLPSRLPASVRFEAGRAALDEFIGSRGWEGPSPLGLASPSTEQEVDRLVAWANEQHVALVPLSSRGGSVQCAASQTGTRAVVADLSGMRRVVHVDAQERIAVIEPGLTFDEFDTALRPHSLRAFRPLLPRAGQSVLATFLDREPMTVANDHWDTTDPLAALSITFGSGEHFRTGSASMPGTLEENLQRGHRQMMATGPIVTDYSRVLLGSQGTLGIVSWASIYCEAMPAREQPLLFGAEAFEPLAELARLLLLQQRGAQCFIVDRSQLAALLATDAAVYASMAASALPRWLLYVNLTSPDYLPDQHMAWQRKAVAELSAQAGAMAVEQELSARLAARLQQTTPLPFRDMPLGQHREVFCLTQLDLVPGLLAQADRILGEAVAGGGMAHGVYVQPTIQGASCHLSIALLHAPAALARAQQAEQRLIETLAGAGGFFSRPYGPAVEVAFGRNPGLLPQLRRVKQLFDPQGVLSPGRLCF